MFLDFYKLREQPFSETPDPRYLYLTPKHREAIASLAYGIQTGLGFLVLTAEPGMGKTTLLFRLLEWLRGSARTAFLFQTQCDSRELLAYLLCDLGIDSAGKELAWMHEQLKDILISEASNGRRLVVFIDEAQNLAEPVLESVRLLSDFENPGSKLIQIVLVGQSQLADKLATPGLAQLRQRVSIVSHLNPLTPSETESYINYRLAVAGLDGRQLFTREALATIATRSRGIPRHINGLCFGALSLGFAMGLPKVGSAVVEEAATDLELTPVVVKPADPQRSHARLSSQDAAPVEASVPPPGEGIFAGRQLAPPCQECEREVVPSSPWRQGAVMLAIAGAHPWTGTIVAALVALFVVGEAGIFILRNVQAQSARVNSAPVTSLSQAKNRPTKTAKNSTGAPRRQPYQLKAPQKNQGPAAEDLVNKLVASPQTVSGLAADTFSWDPRPEMTGAPSDSILELPTTTWITSLPPLIEEENLPVQAGGRMKEPRLTSKAPIIYPAEARLNGIEGDVVVSAVINSNGKPTSLRVVSGPTLLQAAALDSLRKWRYEPGYRDDKAVPVEKLISIEFRLH